jgi:ribosomal protein S18 acetylase RimI-like enzyme
MTQTNRSSIAKLLLILILSCAAIGGVVYYYHAHPTVFWAQGPISEYDAARDKQEILQLFKSDIYWLSADPDYNAEYMLDNRAPGGRGGPYFGQMQLKVLREDNAFVGFVAYYKKTADEGFLNFVCVKPEMRGKHYAEKLMKYAEDDFRAQGVHRIKLLTRTVNHRARALYTRMGYTVTSIDEVGGFVYYMKIV